MMIKRMPSMKHKFMDMQQKLLTMAEERKLSENEVAYILRLLEEQSAVIEVLKQENLQMRERLPQLQPLQEDVESYKQKASESLYTLNMKCSDLIVCVLDLEQKLTQLGLEFVKLESDKTKEIEEINHTWQEMMGGAHTQSKLIIEEIVKKHCEAKKGYETEIHGLKEQMAHKEAELAWCQLLMKERNLNIDKEIASLKKELDVTTTKNQELLQQRLAEVEKRANKMTKKCLKLQQDYEQKISHLKKEKDLQVQALQKYVLNEAERDTSEYESRVEDAVKQLELRYRNIIISLHTSAQLQRQNDMKKIAALESMVGTNSVSEKLT